MGNSLASGLLSKTCLLLLGELLVQTGKAIGKRRKEVLIPCPYGDGCKQIL
ncbi:MAG: hypothetical protein A4E58_01575 [Syntrophorhabdus sp. PtaB.Bin006]|nr:MAG: hypothetical protein A4E58_01575 [Syntrophorhabdus sp. PtaB.Bin006]